jgi:hypothetical protein
MAQKAFDAVFSNVFCFIEISVEIAHQDCFHGAIGLG